MCLTRDRDHGDESSDADLILKRLAQVRGRWLSLQPPGQRCSTPGTTEATLSCLHRSSMASAGIRGGLCCSACCASAISIKQPAAWRPSALGSCPQARVGRLRGCGEASSRLGRASRKFDRPPSSRPCASPISWRLLGLPPAGTHKGRRSPSGEGCSLRRPSVLVPLTRASVNLGASAFRKREALAFDAFFEAYGVSHTAATTLGAMLERHQKAARLSFHSPEDGSEDLSD